MNLQEKIQLQAIEEKLAIVIQTLSNNTLNLQKSDSKEGINLVEVGEILDWIKLLSVYSNFEIEATRRERDLALKKLTE